MENVFAVFWFGGEVVMVHCGSADSPIVLKKGEFILMQFTGLQDKNGRDIYESDQLKDAEGTVGFVEWGDGQWEMDGDRMHAVWAATSEIIGNKYEN